MFNGELALDGIMRSHDENCGRCGNRLQLGSPGRGFDISLYSQAIYRDFYESQRFDITNNFIHDNVCADQSLAGAGFALNNVSGTIKGNVFANNACGRGGAGFLNDTTNQNSVSIENNRIEGNSGTEPDSAHGGARSTISPTLARSNRDAKLRVPTFSSIPTRASPPTFIPSPTRSSGAMRLTAT